MMALYAGHDAALRAIREAFEAATRDVDLRQLEVICVSVPIVVKRVQEEMVRAVVPDAEIVFGHEGQAALVGAIGEPRGVVISSGTGSFAYGRGDSGEPAWVGGGGPLLGDEGSAYYLGVRGLRYALHALDGRKPDTGLWEALQARLGVSGRAELLAKAYGPGLQRREVASLALVVIERAEAGDTVARQVVEEAAAELVVLGRQAVYNLERCGDGWIGEFPFACVGGVMRRSPALRELVTGGMVSVFDRAQPTEPRFPPSVGAALLALQHVGVEVGPAVLEQVERTLPEALK